MDQGPEIRNSNTSLNSNEGNLTRRKNKEEEGWRRIVRNFTPSWFSVTMGTGIVSILLHNLPYNGEWLCWISIVIFALNVILFMLCFLISLLRYTLYPQIFVAMIRHPGQSLFVGTFPMGLATIINMIVFVCVPAWGGPWPYIAWGLWWFDVVVSVICCFSIPFATMYIHTATLQTMLATWLLPIVPPIVAAASGGIVASVLPNPQHALWTIITSYILWGMGVPLAMVILVIYFQRLTMHHLPTQEVIVSVFLPLGPLGQGGFAIMELGKMAMQIFPKTNTLPLSPTVSPLMYSGDILYVVGWLVATMMWGFGFVWLFFAFASITRRPFPFNMGWWGFTFPLGVYTTSTLQMAEELPSGFFRVLGTILAIIVTILWLVVATITFWQAMTGEIFFAPCLKGLAEKEKQRVQDDPALTAA
ncbi:sulfite efflux pump SSU1 [Mollisia scopiformis]|uniref:Sulfite efflux pump SSU1 n=1 Tax=Mollisia scopiformis TaxID=149040 RepID=A0A194XLV5_MOLSC|nr:sulfite efflux pump SSU1 [Mollisia scopiformis]KUJ20747.1 sulfite efflux pump SSU1 [Mollisia scopiformis]